MENNKSVTLFDYKDTKIRTVIIDSDIWFVAKDICDILDIANSRDAVSKLGDSMKMVLVGRKSIVALTDDAYIT